MPADEVTAHENDLSASAPPDYGGWPRRDGARRHGILLVHGMGDPKKGDTLHAFFNDFFNYIDAKVFRARAAGSDDPIHPDLDTDFVGQKARVVFTNAAGTDDFIVREVWWAKSFPPLDFWRALQWSVKQLLNIFHLISRGRLRRLTWIFLVVLVPLLIVFSIVLYLLPSVLQWALPVSRRFLDALSQRLQKFGHDFLVGSVGDVVTFARDILFASEMRHVLEREIDWMKEHVDDMHVVAHSLGSLIAYEVLSRTHREESKFEKGRGVKTLVTVGSPLDKVRWFLKPEHRYRFEGVLPDAITWVNIYTEYDLVSDCLQRYGGRPKNELVTNKEFPPYALMKDHSSYWQNYEVMELILREVASTPVLQTDAEEAVNGVFCTVREVRRRLFGP